MVTRECDAVVVGSGPGGATVARELARAGKDVLLLEKGKYHRDLGSYLGAARMLDRAGFYKSREGVSMLKATTAGGATMVYSGSAAMPPPWLYPKYGIDLNPDAQETWEELGVDFLPDDLAGEASMRVMDAANAIGYQWEKSPKIMDTAKFVNGKCCGARTSLGCTCGAKWTARDYIAQAESAGAAFQTSAECLDVIVENGTAKGVVVRRNDETAEVRAPTVVLAAGGIPTPVLLQRAGIEDAGKGCVIDPTMLVYGIHPTIGASEDPLVSVVTWEFYDQGLRLGTLIDPRLMTFFSLAKTGPAGALKAFAYDRMIGILVKVKDELGGEVDREGRVSKALAAADREKIDRGAAISREILRKTGCPESAILQGEIRGAHPSGTCRIGEVVNHDLETQIQNLYVCDASIFPEALDRPTVITIIAFGKRLVRHILAKEHPA